MIPAIVPRLLYGFSVERFPLDTCPGGCGRPVPVVGHAQFNGSTWYRDARPIHCTPCLQAKLPAAVHDPYHIPPARKGAA